MVSGPAPPLVGWSSTGDWLNLADYRGEVVMVYYWASWCPLCTFTEGSIEKIHKNWPVLTVSTQSGDAATIARHQQKKGLSWNTIIDQQGVIASNWGVVGTPSSFILDQDGDIRFAKRGYTTAWGLRARLWWVKHF